MNTSARLFQHAISVNLLNVHTKNIVVGAKKIANFLLKSIIWLSLGLAGCGGGGGGGGGSNGGGNNGLPLQMAISPSILQWSQFSGNKRQISFKATVTGAVSGDVYVLIQDDGGVIGSFALSNNANVYTAQITTNANMSLGAHQGKLDIRACSNSSCTNLYGQSSVAYSAQVLSDTTTDLRALSPATGVNDWSTQQGGPAHTGYLPMTVDPQRFSNRWLSDIGVVTNYSIYYNLPLISDPISDATHGLCFIHKYVENGSHTLLALNEIDGTLAWTVSTPAEGWPSLDGGKLFVAGATSVNSAPVSTNNAARLLSYDELTGAQLTDTSSPHLDTVSAVPGSPIILNGKVFVNLGSSGDTLARSGQIVAFDENSASYMWASATGGWGGVTPAADTSHVYFYRPNSSFTYNVPDGFTAISTNDGSTDFTVTLPAAGPGQVYYNGGIPVVDGAGGVVVNAGAFDRVDRYDLTAKNLKWSIDTNSQSNATPVVIGDTVYIGAHGGVDARALADGTLRWSWTYGDAKGVKPVQTSNIVATTNVIFVSTDQGIAAVDLTTHQTIWDYPAPGNISLSASGLLYINRSGQGKIAAINLR